jgi:Flp pilus assembly pilin Flp
MNQRTAQPGAIGAAPRGQTMVEYALLLAAIALLVFAAARTMGQNSNTALNNATSKVGFGSSITAGGGTSIPGAS